MAFDAKPDPSLPSYDAALGQAPVHQSHVERVKAVQTQRIQDLIFVHVDPLIGQQASAGLNNSSFIVVPYDLTALHPTKTAPTSPPEIIEKIPGFTDSNEDEDKILGFPDDELVKLVRLQHDQGSLSFWQQPSIVTELQSSLRRHLGVSPPPLAPPEIPLPTPVKPEKRSLWRRMSSAPSGNTTPTSSVPPKPVVPLPSASAQMGVSVSVEEVSLRVKSDFDLWEVRSGRAIVVRIRIGS